MKKNFVILFLMVLVLLVFAHPICLTAQDETYDRYAPTVEKQSEHNLAKKIASDFLVYPLEIPRWMMDQGFDFIEEHYLDKKMLWIYNKIQDQGITPYISIVSAGSLGGGYKADLVRLMNKRADAPNLILKNWLEWNHRVNFETGTQVGMDRIADTGFHAFETFKYESRPEEHFDGIGHHSSAGDGTSYKMEASTLESKIGYSTSPAFSIDGKFAYQNVNITDGEDGGRGIIDTTFPLNSIPGLSGDELISLGPELNHDTRDRGENSTAGGQEKIGFQYKNGLHESDANYFKYQVELSRFFRLWSDRRVFVIHFYGEQNSDISHGSVPFYDMAKLGGYGSYPDLSHTLRGFDTNRFFDRSAAVFNFEYRYTIWEHKDFKLDAVFFEDEGQVFNKFQKLQLKNFRESYGTGLRFSIANNTIFTIEVAHGDEGTNFYVKSRAPF